jgi:hypothetical protein
MPTYIASYRQIESPSRRELDALRQTPGVTFLDHQFGVARITAREEVVTQLQQKFPDWNFARH